MKRHYSSFLLLLGLCSLLLSGCTGYGGKNDTEKNGIFYRVSDSGRVAFVQSIYWDLDPAHNEFTIPDSVGRAQVEELGGFYGTGVPYPLEIVPRRGADYIYMPYPDTYESDVPYSWQDLICTIHIGPGIRDVNRAIPCPYLGTEQEDGSITFYRPVMYFDCDPDNRYLYSRDGILYYRKDNTPVPDMEDAQERHPAGSWP